MKGETWTTFTVRRLARIYVPYAVSVALAVLLLSMAPKATGSFNPWFTDGWSHPVTPGMILDHVLMRGEDSKNTLNPVIWSLVHELRILLLFPILFLAMLRYPCASLVISLVLSLGARAIVDSTYGLTASLLDTVKYGFCFVLGGVMSLRREQLVAWVSRFNRNGLLAVVGLLLMDVRWILSTPANTWIIAAGAALVVISAAADPGVQALLLRKVPQFLGKISYSLYLTHFLVLSVAAALLSSGLQVMAATMLLSIPVAILFYHLVESPSHRLARRAHASGRSASKSDPESELPGQQRQTP